MFTTPLPSAWKCETERRRKVTSKKKNIEKKVREDFSVQRRHIVVNTNQLFRCSGSVCELDGEEVEELHEEVEAESVV